MKKTDEPARIWFSFSGFVPFDFGIVRRIAFFGKYNFASKLYLFASFAY